MTEQEMIERLRSVETCIIGQTFPDGTCENDRYLAGQAAAMIARLVAERDAAREELAQWVEVPRMVMGKDV